MDGAIRAAVAASVWKREMMMVGGTLAAVAVARKWKRMMDGGTLAVVAAASLTMGGAVLEEGHQSGQN
jgi:hypothetical protein